MKCLLKTKILYNFAQFFPVTRLQAPAISVI